MEGSLDEMHRNRGRREGALPYQRCNQNQQSRYRFPAKRHVNTPSEP